MTDNSEDPALSPTGKYDDPFDAVAIKRARDLLNMMPETVGPYRILERIGGGGMGDVYHAEQRWPIRRQVALKFIKLGMDSKAVIARFEAERQALALMDHPHIAKVFDAGTDETGRPYFVMEYVKGKPITEFADENHLTIAERLGLFEQICQAIQHAHHKGVIHRDLKPGNVLVSTQDDHPFAKVIDFGVAKAISQKLTDGTLFTQHDQFIGTPQYMSPEQATGSVDIDTRTDVYSLGILLYELLTGSTPFSANEIKAAAFEQLKKLIIEVDPPVPSTRLTLNTPTLNSLAAFRRIEPKRLGMLVKGELDWIVMKAIEKDRRRRYETPTGLANDIHSHLHGEAVNAAPPSRAYRIQKFVNKNRGLVIATTAIVAALVMGVAVATWGYLRAEAATGQALIARDAATESEKKAVLERDEKQIALVKEAEQRDRAEHHLVSGMLRPVGFNKEGYDQSEVVSFHEWSAIEESRLKLRVLETAFESPSTALRMARRAENVIQACVGLSPPRRASALNFVSRKQRDMAAPPEIRIAACWLALELGSSDLPALKEGVSFLSESQNRKLNLWEIPEFVAFAISRSDPKQRHEASRQLPDSLISVLESSQNKDLLRAARHSLNKLAPNLEVDQVTRGFDALVVAMKKSKSESLRNAEMGIVGLASKLEPTRVTQICNTLIDVFDKSTGEEIDDCDVRVLCALSTRLELPQATRGCDAMLTLLRISKNEYVQQAAVKALVKMVPRLQLTQITGKCDALIDLLEKSTNEQICSSMIDAFGELSMHLEPTQITRGFDATFALLEKSKAGYLQRSVAEALIKLAPRLKSTQHTRACDAFITLLNNSDDSDVLDGSIKALVALAPRLELPQVTRVWDSMFTVLENSQDGFLQDTAETVLVALAPRVDSMQLTRFVNAHIARLQKFNDEQISSLVIDGLDGLAGLYQHLDPTQVRCVWRVLMDVFDEARNQSELSAAGKAFARLSLRLDPVQVTQGNDAMIAVLEKAISQPELPSTCDGLALMALRLDASQVRRGWSALLKLLDRSSIGRNFYHDGIALVVLAARLDPTQVNTECDALITILGKSTHWDTCLAATQALKALSSRLEQSSREKVAAKATLILLDVLASSNVYLDYGYSAICCSEFLYAPRDLAGLLSHPRCVGELRQLLLQRFEELVLHNGQHVFSVVEDTGGNELPPKAQIPERRFHNLHDAAEWIQQNWPEFDLETNCPMTLRDPETHHSTDF